MNKENYDSLIKEVDVVIWFKEIKNGNSYYEIRSSVKQNEGVLQTFEEFVQAVDYCQEMELDWIVGIHQR